MNWEKLTAREFEQGVKDCEGVCLLPIGVLERHGDHLPLGQDVITIHEQCVRAAELEPAMVFPFYFLGKIAEGRHLPGTIALKCELLIPVLENICDEISRNGWLTVAADPSIIFDLPIHERYTAAIRLLGFDPSRLTCEVGHA